MTSPTEQYLEGCQRLIDVVGSQQSQIGQAAEWFAESILAGRMVHLFGAGHSRILAEEMWPRYGSFPGFHPIVELSLTFHNAVVGANGQRQAMFLEKTSGLAEQIVRNFDLSSDDSALVASTSGANAVPIEMAQQFQQRGMRVVAIISKQHSATSTSTQPQGLMLSDCADLVLDNGAPEGDATVHVEGLSTPVAPLSTVGGCMLINAIKAETAARLTAAGSPPDVLTAASLVGVEESARLFNAGYDEHARRVAKLYENLGASPSANEEPS
jgi:uncharacterized phosphosugar-binding protein